MSSTIATLYPSGILDGENTNQLYFEVRDILNHDQGAEIIAIDFTNITFMNSSGIGILAKILKETRNAKRQLYIYSLNSQIQMLFELTKMDRVFQIFAEEDDFKQAILVKE